MRTRLVCIVSVGLLIATAGAASAGAAASDPACEDPAGSLDDACERDAVYVATGDCGRFIDGEFGHTTPVCVSGLLGDVLFLCPGEYGSTVYLSSDHVCAAGVGVDYGFDTSACDAQETGAQIAVHTAETTVCVDPAPCEDADESGVEVSIDGEDTRVCSSLPPT